MSATKSIDNWIPIKEAAKRVDRDRRTIRNYIYQDVIKFTKKGGKEYLIYWPSLKRYMQENASPFIRRRVNLTP